MKLPSLALAILTMAALPQAHATLLVSTDFDAGYIAGQGLNGQSGSGDFNLAGSYGSLANSQVVSAVGGNNLTYQVAGGGVISSGSNVLQFSSSPGGAATLTSIRYLAAPISGQTVFARIVMSAINPSTNPATNVNFFLNSDGNQFDEINGTGLGQNGTSAGAGIGANNATNQFATFGSLSASPSLLVASFNWNATTNAYDSVSFWLNPSATQTAPNAAITLALTTPGVSSLTQIGLAVANLDGGTYVYNFDSFAAGTAWEDVVPAAVPEPSTLACVMAAGLLTLVRLRRRTIA